MKKLTFTIGTQDKDTKQFYDIDKMINSFAQCLECATFTKCLGCYKYNDGSICKEPSIKIEVILFDGYIHNKVFEIVNNIETICNKYNQESYLYEFFMNDRYDATICYVK